MPEKMAGKKKGGPDWPPLFYSPMKKSAFDQDRPLRDSFFNPGVF